LLDGLLGTIEGLCFVVRGTGDIIYSSFNSLYNFTVSVVTNGVDLQALMKDTYQAVYQGWENLSQFVTEVGEIGKLLYDKLNDAAYLKGLVVDIKDAIACYFIDLWESGTLVKSLAYAGGLIAFEAVAAFFTAGATVAIKGSKFVQFMGYLKSGKIGGFITEALQNNPAKRFLCKLKVIDGCFVQNTPILMASSTNQFSLRNSVTGLALAAMPIAVPIQEVNLFDYAVAHKSVNASYGLTASTDATYILDKDPYTSDEQRSRDHYEINDTDWSEVTFEQMLGSSKCKLALHQEWIAQNNYTVEAVVNMNLPEQGISGPFKITSIRHITPQKKPVDEDETDDYAYRPVTGLFVHESNDVWKIKFDNGSELGVTNNHPIFSVSKGDWQHAGHLEIGEEVLAKGGNIKVTSKERDLNIQPVYNLEVKDLHNFLVSNAGVLVHNSCARRILGDVEFKERKDFYISRGHTAAEAEELVEMDALKTGLIDEAINSGKYVEKGLAKTIRDAASDFADDMKNELLSQIGNSALNVVREVTLDIVLNDGTNFTVYADQLANSNNGDLHIGESKYSTKDKEWDKDWKSAATKNQKKFIDALNSSSIANITPRGDSGKLATIGLTNGQSFNPSKIKSFRLFGSNAGSKSIKKILKLF